MAMQAMTVGADGNPPAMTIIDGIDAALGVREANVRRRDASEERLYDARVTTKRAISPSACLAALSGNMSSRLAACSA